MKRLMLLVSVIAACAFTQNAFGFAKYVDITIQNYGGNEVANFPVLVKIDGTKIPGIYSDVKNNGADLSFTDVDNKTEYPYDVDVWDPSGTSLVWVKVPSLSDGAKLRMHYGDVTKTENESASNVWTGYAGVWHLSSGLGDSVANGMAAVAVSPTAPLAAGAIGAGYKISSENVTSKSKTGAIYCPGTTTVDYSKGFTVSAWMNNCSYASTWDEQVLVATCSGFWENKGGFGVRVSSWPNNGKEMFCSNGSANTKLQNNDNKVPPLWDNNVWHLFSLVYDGDKLTVYIDGVSGSSAYLAVKISEEPLTFGSFSNMDVGKIGTEGNDAISWKGGVDECRFTTTIKSVDWLRAEYLVVNKDVTAFGEPQIDTPTVEILPQGVIVK